MAGSLTQVGKGTWVRGVSRANLEMAHLVSMSIKLSSWEILPSTIPQALYKGFAGCFFFPTTSCTQVIRVQLFEQEVDGTIWRGQNWHGLGMQMAVGVHSSV